MLAFERVGDGPPVLFVHGDIVGPSLTWRKQRELAERWTLLIPSRPGFGASPPLERNDFQVEAPMFAELLRDGAHLVGHSYGAVIALLAAAERPEAVRSLTVSEPGCLRVAEGTPEVDEMITNGKLLFQKASSIPSEESCGCSAVAPALPTGSRMSWRVTSCEASSCSSASARHGRPTSRSSGSPPRNSRCWCSRAATRRPSRRSVTRSRKTFPRSGT
jgi:pimeloyl-ACP methyl ester carboxylesterase